MTYVRYTRLRGHDLEQPAWCKLKVRNRVSVVWISRVDARRCETHVGDSFELARSSPDMKRVRRERIEEDDPRCDELYVLRAKQALLGDSD